jgi:hypothetical protein
MVKQTQRLGGTAGKSTGKGTGHAASLLFLKLREPVDEKALKTLKNLLESKKIGHNIGLLKEKLEKLEGIKGGAVKIFDGLNAVKKKVDNGGELPVCLTKVVELEGDVKKFEQGLLSILEMGIKDTERKDIRDKIKRLEDEKKDAAMKFGKADPSMIKEFTEKLERLDVLIEICDVLLKNGGKATKEFLDEVATVGYKLAGDPSSMIVALPDVKKRFEDDREREETAMDSNHRELVREYLKTNKKITRELEELKEALHLMVDVSDEERAVIGNLRKGLEKKDQVREISFENSEVKELAAKLAAIKTHLADENIKLTRIKEQLNGANENNKRNKLLNEQKRLNELISSHTEREGKLERQIAKNNKGYSERMAENKKIVAERIDAAVERVVEDETVIREARARFDGRIKELEERLNTLDTSSMTSTPGSAPT